MIEVGMIVKLWDGTVGEVMKTTVINEQRFHTIREMAQTPWGLCPSFQRVFAADHEIVAVKQTAATSEEITAA